MRVRLQTENCLREARAAEKLPEEAPFPKISFSIRWGHGSIYMQRWIGHHHPVLGLLPNRSLCLFVKRAMNMVILGLLVGAAFAVLVRRVVRVRDGGLW